MIARALGRDQSPACRAEGLRALARCAALGDQIAISAAVKHLQDNDPNVQLAAVELISRAASKGDKGTIAALVSQLTGSVTKDPTQPGAFLNGADPQKRSLAKMAKRPGDHSFRQAPQLRIAAVRALASICSDDDLRVSIKPAACVDALALVAVRALAMGCRLVLTCSGLQVVACVAEVAENDRDKAVRQAALNALVALNRPELGMQAYLFVLPYVHSSSG